MATPIYGFSLYKSPNFEVNEEYLGIGANSTTFTLGDPIATSANGFLFVAPYATSAVLGIAAKTLTTASTNQTVAQVKVPIIPVDQDYTFLAGTNADMGVTSIGLLYEMLVSGGTGQILVDVNTGAQSAGATAVVVCVGVDPQAKGGTGVGSGAREGLFRFVKTTDKTQL